MNPETLQALKDSITHWKRMKGWTLEEWVGFDLNIPPESPMGSYCPLCRLCGYGCTGCPVAAKTSFLGCRGTPWYAALQAFNLLSFVIVNAKDTTILEMRYNDWQEAAQAEIDFLESLP